MLKAMLSKFIRFNSEDGFGLAETAVALALVGVLAVIFLSGMATASRAVVIADERSTGENLARSQMEYLKDVPYVYDAAVYTPASIPASSDYTGYSVVISAQPLNNPDDGVQKIAVTVKRGIKDIVTVEGYKADR